jgi:hypothetical protein
MAETARWIHFRADAELNALIRAAEKKAASPTSSVVRMLLLDALTNGNAKAVDIRLETMRVTSGVIKRAASRVLKEVTVRLPELLKEAGVEIQE